MKGDRKGKRILTAALALLLLLLPAAALAVSVGAQADAPNVQAGDEVEIVVTVSGAGISVAQGAFTYDPAVLTFKEGEGGASDGTLAMASAQKGGADTLSARIRFTAAGAGNATVKISMEKVLGYDGKELGTANAEVSVAVTAPAPTPAPTPLSYAAEGVLAQNVKGVNESLYIWRSLENVTVPSRYSVITLTYHGETVAAAHVEDSDAPTLLYLSNDAGKGGYYIYDEQADTLYPYQTLSSVSKSYILLEPDGGVTLPEGFTQTTLTVDDKQYTAWQNAPDGVYLVYARNPDGEAGYYMYNAADQSMQRYAVLPAPPVLPQLSPAPVTEQAPNAPVQTQAGKIMLSKALFYGVCIFAGLLLIAVVLLLTRTLGFASGRRSVARRRARHRRTRDQGLGQ